MKNNQPIPDEKTLLSVALPRREVPSTLDQAILRAAANRIQASKRRFMIRRISWSIGAAAVLLLSCGVFLRHMNSARPEVAAPAASIAAADRYDWNAFESELNKIEAALDSAELQQIASGGY